MQANHLSPGFTPGNDADAQHRQKTKAMPHNACQPNRLVEPNANINQYLRFSLG
jgi:hypothetical protein